MNIILWVLIIVMLIVIIWGYAQYKNNQLSVALKSYNDTFNKLAATTSIDSYTELNPPNSYTELNPPNSYTELNPPNSYTESSSVFSTSTLKGIGEQTAFSLGINLIAKTVDKKLVQKAGQFALKLAVNTLNNLGTKLGIKAMEKLGAKLALRVGTNVATSAGAKIASQAAVAATMGPAGIAVLALEAVQLGLQIGLDGSDAGGYMKMGTLETYYKMRDEINKEFQKATSKDGNENPLPFPQIYGPLDVFTVKDNDGYKNELKQYSIEITQDIEEPLMQEFNIALRKFIATNPDGTLNDLDNWILLNFDTLVDMDAVTAKAQAKQCSAHGGYHE
jgi:flagellar hook-associated protein FlgK